MTDHQTKYGFFVLRGWLKVFVIAGMTFAMCMLTLIAGTLIYHVGRCVAGMT